ARDAPGVFRDARAAAGFVVKVWPGDALRALARRQIAAQDLAKALLKGNFRAEVARATDLSIGAVSSQAVLAYVGNDAARARWLSELLARSAHVELSPGLV